MPSLFSNLFNRFQLRVFLYLLMVMLVPFLLMIYVLNHQFSTFNENAFKKTVDQKHDQMLKDMTQELRFTAESTHRSAIDFGVIRYAKLANSALNAKEVTELTDYANSLLSHQLEQNHYAEQVCLTLYATNRTLCAQSSEGKEALATVVQRQGPYQRFEPLGTGSSKFNGYMLTYTEQVLDKPGVQELGKVTLWFNMSKLWQELLVQTPVQAYVLLDQQQRVIYRNVGNTGEEILRGRQRETDNWSAKQLAIHSLKQVDLLEGSKWESVYEAPIPSQLMPYYHTWITGVVAFLILICFSSSLLFSTYVTKPLQMLKWLMNRAERGDLRAYWTAKSSSEWTQLGQSYNQMLNRLEDLIKQVKREESLKKEAEIEALHYQLNPHFLYNTLNTIKWVAKIHKTPQISEVVSALVRLLQASLGKKGEFITLREEISLMQDYMEIQKFRYGDRIQVVTDVNELTRNCLVPRMLLQPLVENAIIHGIEPAKREGIITIRTWLDRDLLFCQVEDNGIGMQVEEGGSGWGVISSQEEASTGKMLRERMSGVGITHIREKIKLYYGPQFKMHIGSKPGEGTTIRMSLPIHQDEE
ncbi:hypothetical protein GCM10008018_05680 [Paenibacillus marchantiophytorum]|uniref:histidine kinase n=1 Tax=Paenibacillus marchantiophytorum TaxID=1619310 RepID=A0ABQ2BNX1_9BACL|nr:sensor histidine kinase [Paenibacillus marchantiophytorum]GGI44153.1 hypothetical protein GCM10008018_05680 [Paenibacillus marchantiophytorum]